MATVGDLYRLPHHQKAELVRGELVMMSPTGDLPSSAAGEIFVALRDYARRMGTGRRGEIAEAEPALPSWRLAVEALFE